MDHLGKKAKDKVTGFIGIVTSKHIYLTGCAQYCLQPSVDEKNQIPESKYFDEGRLDFFENVVKTSHVTLEKPGCDSRPHPAK